MYIYIYIHIHVYVCICAYTQLASSLMSAEVIAGCAREQEDEYLFIRDKPCMGFLLSSCHELK